MCAHTAAAEMTPAAAACVCPGGSVKEEEEEEEVWVFEVLGVSWQTCPAWRAELPIFTPLSALISQQLSPQLLSVSVRNNRPIRAQSPPHLACSLSTLCHWNRLNRSLTLWTVFRLIADLCGLSGYRQERWIYLLDRYNNKWLAFYEELV